MQHFRHFLIDDLLGNAFGDGGFTDAGFPHKQRVILAPSAQDLDGALHLMRAPDERVYATEPGLFVEVGRICFQGFFCTLILTGIIKFSCRAGLSGFVLGMFGNTVRDEVHHIEARHILLVQEKRGVGFAFGKNGDQDIGAADFLFAGGLYVLHGALKYPLKAQSRLGFTLVIGFKAWGVILNEIRQFVL